MPTNISWATDTWNWAPGCQLTSEGCGMPRPGSGDAGVPSCYALHQAHMRASNPNAKIAAAYEGLTHRRDDGLLDWTGKVNLLEDRLTIPLHWRKPRRVFVNSMGDSFNDAIPDGFLARAFAVMAACPQHTFIVLTKKHARMRSLVGSYWFREMVAEAWLFSEDVPDTARGPLAWPLSNVWLGVSVETQKWADIRIPALLTTPAARRWVSFEPLLGPVDLSKWTTWPDGSLRYSDPPDVPGLDWAVVGGESGPTARPMHPAWARSLRGQCQEAEIAFHFKQWGEWSPEQPQNWRDYREPERCRAFMPDGTLYDPTKPDMWNDPELATMYRVGRRVAGRKLDGREWNEYPLVVAA